MEIKRLSLVNFRNFHHTVFEFSPEGAMITGPNGIGKTNLLEGISYAAFGRSFRSLPDSDLVQFHKNRFLLEGHYLAQNKSLNIKILFTDKKKQITLNDVRIDKLSELYRYLKIVYFSPDDIQVVAGGPKNRRHFFDQAIAQYDFSYMDLLKKYHNLLLQRNAMLKATPTAEEKTAWDENFFEAGCTVVERRKRFLAQFQPVFTEVYARISKDAEIPDIRYSTEEITPQEPLIDAYRLFIRSKGNREVLAQRTLFGPHLDDYQFILDQQRARIFGSQGQKRSLAIALKFALVTMIARKDGEYPIVIFDDVLSDLDPVRSGQILDLQFGNSQVFIATPNSASYPHFNLPVLELTAQNFGADDED